MQYSQKTTQEEIDKRGNCQWKRSKIEVFKNSAVAVTFYIDCADIVLRNQFKQGYETNEASVSASEYYIKRPY